MPTQARDAPKGGANDSAQAASVPPRTLFGPGASGNKGLVAVLKALPQTAQPAPWLVKHPTEWRQIGIVAIYLGLLASMVFVPACRNVLFLGAACYFSFLNAVVIHNHLHQGIFHSRRLN